MASRDVEEGPSSPLAAMICPICEEVMEDPVFLAETGHTFERKAISAWLKKQETCPLTRQVLTTKTLVANWGLRSAIAEWRMKAAEVSSRSMAVLA